MSSSEPQQPHPSQAQPPQDGLQPLQPPQFAQPDPQQSWPQQAAQQQYRQAAQYAQPQYAQQQYAQQPGAQQQYGQQPGAQPQYAQPQYAQQQYAPAGVPQQRDQSAAVGSLNVPGIIALVLLLLTTFIPLLTPALYRAAATSDSFSAISAAISGTNALLLIVAGALAVVGLVVRRFTRWRWAAIGAAVAVAVGFLSFVFSWVGGLVMGAPWFS